MSSELRNTVLEEVSKRVRAGALDQFSDAVELAILGIDSMDLLTILMDLETRVGLELDRMVGLTPPKTVSELLRMVENACD